jgi:cardiolipin synthase
VRVLVPGPHHDVALVRAGQRRTYERLLRGGVRIWEYGASMMHAKTLVVDDVAAVGSTNMDSQSLSFLWETSVVAESRTVADRQAERFLRDLSRSREIRLGAWRRRPLEMKAGEAVAGVADPWL